MKLKEKQEAIKLRKRGDSITTIAQTLGVSKASVSYWVKDVELSKAVLQKIKSRSHSALAVEKRREARLKAEDKKREQRFKAAKNQISPLNKISLFHVGIALYWGEGSKKKRGVVEFTNSDPKMIAVMKKFLLLICKVPKHKFRGHVYIHSHIDSKKAEEYWSRVSGIPLEQFHKTSVQHNTKKLKKDTLPYGTFAIVVCDTNLKLAMDGWIAGLHDNVV